MLPPSPHQADGSSAGAKTHGSAPRTPSVPITIPSASVPDVTATISKGELAEAPRDARTQTGMAEASTASSAAPSPLPGEAKCTYRAYKKKPERMWSKKLATKRAAIATGVGVAEEEAHARRDATKVSAVTGKVDIVCGSVCSHLAVDGNAEKMEDASLSLEPFLSPSTIPVSPFLSLSISEAPFLSSSIPEVHFVDKKINVHFVDKKINAPTPFSEPSVSCTEPPALFTEPPATEGDGRPKLEQDGRGVDEEEGGGDEEEEGIGAKEKERGRKDEGGNGVEEVRSKKEEDEGRGGRVENGRGEEGEEGRRQEAVEGGVGQ
ncbi:unnamed protein product [Closterium sp. NIES-65]|nr:unnamed protein product [Closterium sp. NIES-65]CAI5985450.1 unnamed protein product [Closterium sp. NIES-65]